VDSPAIYTLGCLEPFISLHRLFVTPVIAFLAQPAILKSLKASEVEVSHIFSHPLEAMLDPALVNRETLVAIGSDDWPYQSDVYVCFFKNLLFILLSLIWSLDRIQVIRLYRCSTT
jgi:coenzyme A diphosphatase NUDT7